MPPKIPVRTKAANFHYHTYDFKGSVAFVPGSAVGKASKAQFYSLREDLAALQRAGTAKNVPNIALSSIGASCEGREMLMLSLGPDAGVADAPAVVITGGIHAREWIAAEFVYLLAEYLVMHYTAAPQDKYQRTIKNIIDSRRIRIIPMLNPDGNHYTVFDPGPKSRIWRKNRNPLPMDAAGWVNALTTGGGTNPPFENAEVPGKVDIAQYDVPDYDPGRRIPPRTPAYQTRTLETGKDGVDLNRNYATRAWGYDTETVENGENKGRQCWDPALDVYFGPSAGSEAETANVQAELANLAGVAPGIATSIDYHSYGKFIVYPSETFHAGAVGPDYEKLGRALRQLVHTQDDLDYQLGSPAQLLGYDATGSIIDRIAQQHHARAFTIELDPALDSDHAFELPERLICSVFEKNIRGALAALAAPRRPASAFGVASKNKQISRTTQDLLTWDVYGHGNQLPEAEA